MHVGFVATDAHGTPRMENGVSAASSMLTRNFANPAITVNRVVNAHRARIANARTTNLYATTAANVAIGVTASIMSW